MPDDQEAVELLHKALGGDGWAQAYHSVDSELTFPATRASLERAVIALFELFKERP